MSRRLCGVLFAFSLYPLCLCDEILRVGLRLPMILLLDKLAESDYNCGRVSLRRINDL